MTNHDASKIDSSAPRVRAVEVRTELLIHALSEVETASKV